MSFPEFPGASSRDELLERVRKKGARRRALRWTAIGVPLAAVAVLVSLLAVSQGGSPRTTHVASADGAVPSVATTTTTTVAPTTPATSIPLPTTTFAPPKPRAPAVASTTTTTSPVPVCEQSDFAIATTTDRSSYPQGATVTIIVTAQNVSGHPCMNAPPRWLQTHHRGASVQTASGAAVWDDRRPIQADLAMPTYMVPAGGTVTLTTPWNQSSCASPQYDPKTDGNGCTGPPVAPGEYKAFDGLWPYKPIGGSWVGTYPSAVFEIQ